MNENNNNNINQMEEGISLIELYHIFKNRFIWFLLTLIIVVSAAGFYLYLTIPEYSSTVTILVDQIKSSSSSLDDMILSGMSSSSSKISTEIELIKSKNNLDAALELLDLTSYKNSEGRSYDTFYSISSKSDRLAVSSVKDTQLVSVTITDENPKFATDLANAISRSYDFLLTGIAKNSRTVQREFLEQQIPLNEQELLLASNILSDYKEQSGIMQLSEKSSSLVNQIAFNEIRKEPLKLEKIDSQNKMEIYKDKLKERNIIVPGIDEVIDNDEFDALKASYSSSDLELLMYGLAYSSKWNDSGMGIDSNVSLRTSELSKTTIQTSNLMLDNLNRNLSQYSSGQALDNQLISNYAKYMLKIVKSNIDLELLGQISANYTKELDQLPVIERQLTKYERDVSVLQQISIELRSMLEQVKLTEAAITGKVTIIDKATIPLLPVSPNVMLILAVAILLGMALGLLACILIEMKDNTIQSKDDLKKILGSTIPILGWVPLLIDNNDKKNKAISKPDRYPFLHVYNHPDSIETEKFMGITSNIIYGRKSSNYKIFTITSCGMSSGKSTAISNIAMCLTQMGSKVLVVDGDLRMPSVQASFGYSDTKLGCVDCIMEDVPLKDVILQPIDDIPNLHILPAGTKPPVPSAVFANPKFEQMNSVLKDYYDYILYDAPPLEFASEVLKIAQLSDLIFISTRAYVTTKSSLNMLIENLWPIKDKIAGAILNGYILSSSDSESYDGYEKYGYNVDGKKKNENRYSANIITSKRKAKNIYKQNLQDRLKRKKHYINLHNFAPIAKNLSFDISDYFEKNSNKKSNKTNNIEKIVAKRKNDISYDSLLEDLENDPKAKGKQKN